MYRSCQIMTLFYCATLHSEGLRTILHLISVRLLVLPRLLLMPSVECTTSLHRTQGAGARETQCRVGQAAILVSVLQSM